MNSMIPFMFKYMHLRASLVALQLKCLPAMQELQEMWV